MSIKYKNICIKAGTYAQLLKEGTFGDTFDSIITKLINTSRTSTTYNSRSSSQ